MSPDSSFDLAVVGVGTVGLGCAFAATGRRGKRVGVIGRDAQANGASVRNFGFVTVTAQAADDMWRRARRSRDVWAEIAADAGLPILHEGLLLPVRRPRSAALPQPAAPCLSCGTSAISTLRGRWVLMVHTSSN